jgi:hypothetical protein
MGEMGGNTFGVQPHQRNLSPENNNNNNNSNNSTFSLCIHTSALLSSRDIQIGK